MGHARGRPTPRVQEPDVSAEWTRAEPTPQQARAWRQLWQKLLTPNAQSEATAPSPTVVEVHGEASDGANRERDGAQELSRGREHSGPSLNNYQT